MSESQSMGLKNGEQSMRALITEQWTYAKYKEVAMRCGMLCGHPPDDAVTSKISLFVSEALGTGRGTDQHRADGRPG